MNMIDRNIDNQKVNKLLEKYSIVILTGPRGIGKTTFAKNLNPDYYFSLDLQGDYEKFKGLIDSLSGLVVLDEAVLLL